MPLIVLKCRALNVDTPNPRHRSAEPSSIRCRAFGQLVEPKYRFSTSPHALHQKHLFVPLSPFRQHSNAIGTTLIQLWDSTHTTMGRHSCNYGTVLSCKAKDTKTAALRCYSNCERKIGLRFVLYPKCIEHSLPKQ